MLLHIIQRDKEKLKSSHNSTSFGEKKKTCLFCWHSDRLILKMDMLPNVLFNLVFFSCILSIIMSIYSGMILCKHANEIYLSKRGVSFLTIDLILFVLTVNITIGVLCTNSNTVLYMATCAVCLSLCVSRA